jgi:hypothetical protein
MRSVPLFFCLSLFGCLNPPEVLLWSGGVRNLPLTVPLASGGETAGIVGLQEQVDIESSNPGVATGQYGETKEMPSSDPFNDTITTRFITVTSGVAGTTTFTLRRAGQVAVFKKISITVADPAQILFDQRVVFVSDMFRPNFSRATADGTVLIGSELPKACTATGAIVDAYCNQIYVSDSPGDATLHVTLGKLTASFPMHAITLADVQRIDIGPLQRPAYENPWLQLTAQSAAGPAYGGPFNCTGNGLNSDSLLLDSSPNSGTGATLTFYQAPGGKHTVTCTIGAVSASFTVHL